MPNDPHSIANLNLGVPQYPGKIFYVSNASVLPEGSLSASNNNSGLSPREPLSTIAGALDKCTASRGDLIIAMPGHSETLTAQLDLDVAGVTIRGIGEGSLRPKLTGNGAIDMIDVSAANMTLEHFEFGSPGTDAQTAHVNIDAAGFILRDIKATGSETSNNVVDCLTLTANADDCLIENVEILNRVVAVNSFISFEGAASTVRLRNVLCFGDCATGGIIDAAKIDYLLMDNVRIVTVGTTIPACILDSNPEGYAYNCFMAGTHTTLATNADIGNLMRVAQFWVLEETDGSAQGARIPAVDVN